ncbi:MAG: endolytic transglycosylase MltG [Candidatus Saccharimonadales bacterium]
MSSKEYSIYNSSRRHMPRRLYWVFGAILILLVAVTVVIRKDYYSNLQPLDANSTQTESIEIKLGLGPNQIGDLLHDRGLIQSSWSFKWYVKTVGVRDDLKAGTYSLSPSQSVQDMVTQLTHGKVATKLVMILPGQRLDQIRKSLINDGFSEVAVDAALQPTQYETSSALVDKPLGNSLEGYLYPDSFQKTSATDPKTIIEESLSEMQKHLTPDMRAAFAKEGLSTYQGVILASIVEKEVSNQTDRTQAAQVFLKRLQMNMALGSDVTAIYGAINAGQPNMAQGAMLSFDTPYNTLIHTGLPPTPISNVSDGSLKAVAHPANTDWLFFVSGDDGVTHFAKTLEQHEANTALYCHKLCGK